MLCSTFGVFWGDWEEDFILLDRLPLGSTADAKELDKTHQEYVEKYGQDNADYLMEVMGAWKQNYNRAAYIEPTEIRLPDYTADVREQAERRGWKFEKLEGSIILMRDLFEGRWDEARYLVVPAGQTLTPSFDTQIIKTCP